MEWGFFLFIYIFYSFWHVFFFNLFLYSSLSHFCFFVVVFFIFCFIFLYPSVSLTIRPVGQPSIFSTVHSTIYLYVHSGVGVERPNFSNLTCFFLFFFSSLFSILFYLFLLLPANDFPFILLFLFTVISLYSF